MKKASREGKVLRMILAVVVGMVLMPAGCIDEDAGDIDPALIYDATFSLPVGDTLLRADQFVDTLRLRPVPDTVDPDTVDWFLYDGTFYFSPGLLYHHAETELSLAELITDTSEIVALMFRLNAVNSVPARMGLQLYFADASRRIFDSLYPDGPLILEPAPTDADGGVRDAYRLWEKDVYLEGDRLDRMQDLAWVFEEYFLEVPDPSRDSIPFWPDQELWLQLGMRVGIKILLQ